VFLHINDLKVYQRPCTTDWNLNDKTKGELCAKLDVAWTDFDELFLNAWKNKQVFVDIGKAAGVEVIFAKALNDLPRRLVILIPESKERTFYNLHQYVLGEFVPIPHDSDSFVKRREVTRFRIWKSWLGLYEHKALKSVAKEGDWIRKMFSGVEGEVFSLDVPENPEPCHPIDSTPEVH